MAIDNILRLVSQPPDGPIFCETDLRDVDAALDDLLGGIIWLRGTCAALLRYTIEAP